MFHLIIINYKKVSFICFSLFLTLGIAQEVVIKHEEGDGSCEDQAWDFGSRWDGMLGEDAYYWTNHYYINNCL